jgi:hypothetical protein
VAKNIKALLTHLNVLISPAILSIFAEPSVSSGNVNSLVCLIWSALIRMFFALGGDTAVDILYDSRNCRLLDIDTQ